MAFSSSIALIRASVLRHLRIPVNFSCQQCVAPTLTTVLTRGFAGGVYLDKSEVTERVVNVTKHFNKVDQGKVSPTAHFEKDLGLDSLDVVELVMAFEEEFAIEIPDADADKIFTVEDAVNYVSQHPQAK